MTDLVGRRIDQYRIDVKLGEGGMGAVYRAQDLNLNRAVALKVMGQQLARNATFQQRFMQEAQAAARLDHPSIVKVYDFGTTQGLLYMVMAFIPGGNLAGYIKQMQAQNQVLELRELLLILAQIADALAYAHRNGVVHRDIKPDNVLLQRLDHAERAGEPPVRAVVTDFGLAKLLEGGVETATGTFMGTMAYMSPEQALGKPLDGRSDIYSLGVMLYQLTTGQLPFDIKTPTEAVMKHLHETPPPPQSVRVGVPAAIVAILGKALAKSPASRYQEASSMAQDLRQAAVGLTPQEVTLFAPAGSVVSLATQLVAATPPPQPSRPGNEIGAASVDQLIVTRHGETPRAHKLEKGVVTLGRVETCDIMLDEAGVSRTHARLVRTGGGWQIVDLGSTNGTFLDGSRLLPDVPETWQPSQTLRIGSFHMQWRPASAAAGMGARVQSPGIPGTIGVNIAGTQRPVPPGSTQMYSSSGQIGLVVSPTNVDVAAGGRADIQVELLNQGITVDHFSFSVDGLPKSWIKLPQDALQLMPGAQGGLPLTIQPPRDSSATAGVHTYRLTVRSAANPQERATVSGQINIQPFAHSTLEVSPTQLKNGSACRVQVHNQGNVRTSFQITGTDPAESLLFQGLEQPLTLNPGQQDSLLVKVAARRRPFLGRTQTQPFTLGAATPSGEVQRQAGQLAVSPVIPGWLVSVAGILAILLCIGGAYALNAMRSQQQAATETAVAVAAAVQQQQEAQIMQTAAAQQTLDAQATVDFLTAVASGDNDGDGLSNLEEQMAGTDPNNPDTDGDGLTDYIELRQKGTDPKKDDTDGDGLKDGEEVALGTSPTNPDTDGDGIPDGIDPDPLSPPTVTPTLTTEPTATPSPPPTATATPVPGVWSGVWESQCLFVDCNQVTLEQTGNDVTGTYANGAGSLTGVVEGNLLAGQWSLGGVDGEFDFWIAEDGQTWQGNWDRTFNWCGFRSGGSAPSPCGVARWYGDWDTDCGLGSNCSNLTIIQTGSEIVGTYADGNGSIEGTVEGNELSGTWTRGSTGDLAFFMATNGQQFSGNYNSSFEWCGHRSGETNPSPCLNQGDVIFPIGTLVVPGFFIIATPPPFIFPGIFILPTATPVLNLINPGFILLPTATP